MPVLAFSLCLIGLGSRPNVGQMLAQAIQCTSLTCWVMLSLNTAPQTVPGCWKVLNRIAICTCSGVVVQSTALQMAYYFLTPIGTAGVDGRLCTCWNGFTCQAHCWPLSDVELPIAVIIFCPVGFVSVGTGMFAEFHPRAVVLGVGLTRSCWPASSSPLSMLISTCWFCKVLISLRYSSLALSVAHPTGHVERLAEPLRPLSWLHGRKMTHLVQEVQHEISCWLAADKAVVFHF